jgi:hypothetical protein
MNGPLSLSATEYHRCEFIDEFFFNWGVLVILDGLVNGLVDPNLSQLVQDILSRAIPILLQSTSLWRVGRMFPAFALILTSSFLESPAGHFSQNVS